LPRGIEERNSQEPCRKLQDIHQRAKAGKISFRVKWAASSKNLRWTSTEVRCDAKLRGIMGKEKKTTVRILTSGDESALEAFLLPRIESSMFLLGNMRSAGLVDNGKIYQGTYAAGFQDGKLVGVVAHFWNGNFVFQAPGGSRVLCAAAVKGSGRPVKGLIGPDRQVQSAKQAAVIDPQNIQMDETERLFGLELRTLAVPALLASDRVKARRVTSGDVGFLARWNAAYAVEALGAEDGPELRKQSQEESERYAEEKRTWVLEAEGRPVACSSFNTSVKEAVQVGGVWTPPEFRGRGYARSVVAASLLDARAEGVQKAILFTGDGNIAARKAYESLGFRCIGDYSIFLLKTPLERTVW
jgi:predicted GNAT family acetyltransferase